LENQKENYCVNDHNHVLILIKKKLKESFMKSKTVKAFAFVAALMMGPAMVINAVAQAMYPSKNIVENAVNSKDHSTLVAAVKAAGLVETLQSAGPFTVFAPVNSAFDALPNGTVATLLKPENKDQLIAVLSYHVVAGKLSSKDLAAAIKKGNGKAMMKTVQGDELTFMMKGKELWVMDTKGGKAKVTIKDVNQSNGVIHVIDKVLLP
jgi:uncharacterized surface protein with fasciclin (FAS1) repeats